MRRAQHLGFGGGSGVFAVLLGDSIQNANETSDAALQAAKQAGQQDFAAGNGRQFLDLRDDFAIPHVALRLWNRPEHVEELPEFAEVSEELQVFAETLGQPFCGSSSGFETSSWFGEASKHVRSQALIAMRNGGGTIGMIALGSEEAQRFYSGMGTLYLERLGEMASAALARVLR